MAENFVSYDQNKKPWNNKFYRVRVGPWILAFSHEAWTLEVRMLLEVAHP